LKRGESRFFYLEYSPIKLGVKRASDGFWEFKGKRLPYVWANLFYAERHSKHGIGIKIGEYMIYFAWFGFVDW